LNSQIDIAKRTMHVSGLLAICKITEFYHTILLQKNELTNTFELSDLVLLLSQLTSTTFGHI